MRRTEQEIHAGLTRLHENWGHSDEAASDSTDSAITSLLQRAISLQESDPDTKVDAKDKRVLSALRAALAAQEADSAGEGAAAGMTMKTCPMCEGAGKVPAY